ncbi:ABC transporter ATP-binding protein [Nonomuraea sp. NPDC049400]|uniref:ABC transporter ATP-binding protein n=1 Tax=Nonomuraea sp. NPDC049400 TaxID=3364352 RepID=UPI0037B4A94B
MLTPKPGQISAEPAPASSWTIMIRIAVVALGLASRAAPFHLALYGLLVILMAALPVATAWLIKLILDRLGGSVFGPGLYWLGAGLAIVGLITALLPQAVQYLRGEMERRTALLAQDRLYTAVGGFPGLGRFEDPRFLDRLRLAEQAAARTSGQLFDGLLGVTAGALTTGGFIASLAVLDPAVTGALLLSMIPILLAEISLSRSRARMLWSVSPTERRELFYGWLLSNVDAAKEVRLFGAGAFLRKRMSAERQAANAAKRRMDRRELVIQSTLSWLSATVAGGGLLLAIHAAGQGKLTAGDIALFIAAVAGTQASSTNMVSEIATAHHALLLFGYYRDIVSSEPDLKSPAQPLPLPVLSQGIRFRDVWFRYSPDHPWALRGIDLFIPHGQAIGLVGANGAGKSTLVKLLCRFYDPERGAILWDGVDIRDVPVDELRTRICAVFQDYMCYDLTAAENIAIGDVRALGDRPSIEKAARNAGIHRRLAELPLSYDTMLSRTHLSAAENSETGVLLSEGQWQRLALARGLLREGRELMILDEPSSGLDAEAEHEIHIRLREHRHGQTSLLISHRLGTVRTADHIVVLADGRVAEEGTHDQLMASGGVYERLFSLQAEGYQPGNSGEPDDAESDLRQQPVPRNRSTAT